MTALTITPPSFSPALERVMREVLAMKKAGDIERLVETVWGVLRELDFEFVSCALMLMDEERDWVTSYNIWDERFMAPFGAQHHAQRLGSGLRLYLSQTSLSATPSRYESAVAAWRRGTVEQHVLSQEEIQELVRLNRERYGGNLTVESYRIRFYLHMPFSHGVFTLRTANPAPDQFSGEQVAFLKRLVEVFSSGYARYREFLQVEQDRAVQKVRAEVQAMQQASSIAGVLGLLWEELHRAGVGFDYMSISVNDQEEDFVHLYSVWHSGYRDRLREISLPLLRADIAEGADLYYNRVPRQVWEENHTETTGIWSVNQEGLEEYVSRLKRLWQVEKWPVDLRTASAMAAPFSQGRLLLAQFYRSEELAFIPENLENLEAFAQALGLGFARFFDFQRLERQNRSLTVERALERVRAEVFRMTRSDQITRIVQVIWKELEGLGYEFFRCSIGTIDEAGDYYGAYYITTRPALGHQFSGFWSNIDGLFIGFLETPLFSGGPYRRALIEAWQRGEVYRHLLVDPQEKKAMAAFYERVWKLGSVDLESIPDQFCLYVPFVQGVLCVVSEDLDTEQFTGEDIALFRRFGETFGEGYARFLELRHLEVQRAADLLRAEVGAMRKSSDIVGVVTLLGQQLRELGMEFASCSISLLDEEAGMVRLYGVGPIENFRLLPQADVSVADRSIIDRLGEESQGPIFIHDIAAGLDFGYTAEPMEGSPALEERDQPPRIVRRTEEDAQQMLERYRQRWAQSWTVEHIPRTALRVPFSHGSIAVAHWEVGRYTQKDVDLVMAFADAISLGFTRFLDFQRLEQRNRELEVERAVERVQSAVQGMKSSADIVLVIPLISEGLQHLGLEYDLCSVTLVDREAERVRFYGMVVSQVFLSMWREIIQSVEQPLGPDALERLEYEEGPLFISGMPGYEGRVVHYVSAPLDSYYGRIQNIAQTTSVLRTEEEALKLMPEYQKHWKVAFPPELLPRALLRSPFMGGTIALNRRRPESFTEREAQILERFSEAFSLGYARHLDFRRLEEQNKALEAASRVKSEFLANMSHELRTPMNSIINFSSLILEGVYGDISDDLRDAVQEIDRNSENLLALINDILDLSKIEAGAMSLQLSACAPEGFVETAIATMERKATEKGLELISEVEGELPMVRADERRITLHVLINLVKNAIKFTREGQVRVGARKEGEEVLFWVADTGIGIPEEERERIFETFHQVDSSITREAEGTGLGLAIARKFVELHGGRIWVESEPSEGSTFWFTLPSPPGPLSHGERR